MSNDVPKSPTLKKLERAYKVTCTTHEGDTFFVVTSSRPRAMTYYSMMLKNYLDAHINLGVSRFDKRNIGELP
jgi:hypothetical protein